MQFLAFVLARFSEPSSYAGLGALLALVGLHFSDSDLGQIAQFLAAGCALAALLLKERGLIQVLLLAVFLGAALGACDGPGSPTISPQVQADCAVIAWGVPIVAAMAAKLNPNDQAILDAAEPAVGACAAGNPPATLAALAAALTAIIYPPAS
jgi:hypothetical protein